MLLHSVLQTYLFQLPLTPTTDLPYAIRSHLLVRLVGVKQEVIDGSV